MPMTGAGLKAAIVAELEATLGPAYVSNTTNQEVLTAICTAIVLYIQTQAVVTTSDTGEATVTSAPGVAPVVATGTGTIS